MVMNREPWLALLLIAALTLVVFTVCSGNARTSSHVEAAESLQDSLDALAPAREAAEATAAQQDTLVAELRAKLEAERDARVAERDQTDITIAGAQQAGADALNAARAQASEAVGRYLDEHAAEDSVMVAGYESKITSLEADTTALATELVETRRQALFAQRGWDVAEESLMISVRESAAWQAAYRAHRKKSLLTNIGGGALLVLALVVR